MNVVIFPVLSLYLKITNFNFNSEMHFFVLKKYVRIIVGFENEICNHDSTVIILLYVFYFFGVVNLYCLLIVQGFILFTLR